MKKIKIIGIFSLLLLSLITFVSCGEQKKTPYDTHTCSFSAIWSKNDSKHWKECSCGKRSEETSHSFGEWQEVEQATTSKEGLKEQTCSICSYKKQEKINKVEPIYSWKSVDLLQPNIIMGGTSSIVLDENGNKVEYVKLADRQLDMLAQEIISRLEYVYGNTNASETHNIIDNLNNKTFTSYNSMNVFSDSLSNQTKYPAYDNNGNSAGQGYIMMKNGEKVVYDSSIHSHYATVNGTNYAAVCSANMSGIFVSETALQNTFEALKKPTIAHKDNSYDHEGILTFQGAIFGTPTWEYEEKGTYDKYYEFSYNEQNKTNVWNWAEEFTNGTAVKRLKNYLTYIICNNIHRYSELTGVTITATQTIPIDNIYVYPAYLMVENNLISNLIINEIIGTSAYNGDKAKGEIGEQIATAIYTTSQSFSSEASTFYDNGIYRPLYNMTLLQEIIDAINSNANTNLAIQDFVSARNYKGYDVVVNGILRQIANQSAYKPCNALLYERKNISSSITTSLEETDVYLFFKSKTTNEVRICLNVPYATEIKLIDKDGKEVSFTKENVDGKLTLKINGSKLPNSSNFNSTILKDIQGYGATTTLEEKFQGLDYLKLTLKVVNSFTLTTEEYIQIN